MSQPHRVSPLDVLLWLATSTKLPPATQATPEPSKQAERSEVAAGGDS